MRILDCHRSPIGLVAGVALLLAGSASAQAIAGQGITQVETFTASGIIDCTMPGSADGTGGVTFASQTTLQSVNFSPGTTWYNGSPVEFDGREASYLTVGFNVPLEVPIEVGPGLVAVVGTGTLSGGGHGGGGGGGCLVTGGDVPLGPGFSPTNLQVLTGPGIVLTGRNPVWSGSNVPQLNGRPVSIQGPLTVVSVDAVNGNVSYSMSGTIYVQDNAVPALSTFGFLALAIGLVGFAVVEISRRLDGGRAPTARG